MIRSINFTGRRRVPKDRASITLRTLPSGHVAFDADLDLSGLDLPPDAAIFIEAAFKASFMRFAWGSVAAPTPAADRRLIKLAQPALAHFRVKIVASARHGLGRLLAVGDHIAPEGIRSGLASRVPLFRVSYTAELVDEVWRLSFEDDEGPILELQALAGIKDFVRQEAFGALVFPQVLRLILQRIFDVERVDDVDFQPEAWPARWLKFGAQLSGRAHPALNGDERQAEHDRWIDAVVSGWSRRNKVIPNFKRRYTSPAQ